MKGRRTLFIALTVALMIVSTAVVAVAHSSSNRTVIDAPNKVEMEAHHGGDVRWILPGLRELDPAIFGTPDNPKREELLPLEMRAVTADNRYVAGKPGSDGAPSTPMPNPFSNNSTKITGAAEVEVKDVTSVSGTTTQDEVDAKFEFTSPDGKIEYKVVVKKALPEIPGHENFGGVGINTLMHGATGIGTPLMPQVMSFITFWGAADLYVNGTLAPQKRFVHFMLSERVRTPVNEDGNGYTLAFDKDVNPEGAWQAHLILPPVALTADGPVDSPVPTKFLLKNGEGPEQPFLHIMYDTVRVDS